MPPRFFILVIHEDLGLLIESGLTAEPFKTKLDAINETNPIVHRTGDGSYWTALHEAANYGKVDILEFIASIHPDINPYDNKGTTPMHLAAKNNKTSAIMFYLESNISDKSPGQKSNDIFQGRTPLHYASEAGYLQVVKLIINHIKYKGECIR